MDRPFIFKTLFISILILELYTNVQANTAMKKEIVIDFSFSNDTAKYQRQDDKKNKRKEKTDNKEKPEQKLEPDKPDIKEVPKARKQTRPSVVVKPNIKVKPIKIIRPKIRRP